MKIITLENGKEVKISDSSYQKLAEAIATKKRWRGDENECYWNISDGIVVEVIGEKFGFFDDKRYKIGNYYQTRELVMQARDRQLALMRLRDYSLENMPFEPDWSNSLQIKFYVYYDHEHGINRFITDNVYEVQEQTELPYFKSMNDCNKFIEDNEQDLKIVFNIKE